MSAIDAAVRAACGAAFDQPLVLAAVWNTNSDATECELCRDEFTLFNRK